MPNPKIRLKAAGYHGIQNMQFAPATETGYAATPLKLLYAKNLNPTALLEAVEQHADNRLISASPAIPAMRARSAPQAQIRNWKRLSDIPSSPTTA